MDTSTEAAASREEPAKKSPYDELSREDLIKKCKGLLSLAQKAKLSKQDLQAEFDQLKQQLERSDVEKKTNAESLRTMQELVDSLTEQKLNYITELDSANGKAAAVAAKLVEAERKRESCESRVAELSARMSDLDSEVVSLRRQNQRLVVENEELISQLGELESKVTEVNSLGLQQREQLKILEETVDKGTSSDIVEEYQKKIDELNEQIASLEKDVTLKNEKLSEIEQETKSIAEKLCQETKKCDYEREKKEKANTRLKSYREKLIKCGSCITQLKNTKFILTKTVKDYAESIPKWQDDMVKISKMLSEQFNEITSENNSIKQQLLKYEEKLNETRNAIGGLQKENDELKVKNEELNGIVESLRNDNSQCESTETLCLQIKALESEKMILVKEKQAARDGLVELEAQNKKYAGDVKSFHSKIDSLEARINYLECENTTLKEQLSEKDTKQCKELKEKLKILQEQFDALKIENTNIADLNNLLTEEVETLKSSLERPTEDGELSELNVSLQTDVMKLETKLAAYKQENASLLAEMKESRIKIKEMTAANAELEDAKAKMLSYKTENAELLNEMKEINHVMKERGESISKKDKAIAEMERLVETLEKDRAALSESKSETERRVNELETELEKLKVDRRNWEVDATKLKADYEEIENALAEKESVLTALRDEVEKLKQHQMHSNMDQPSEDMSTSTISRAEEHSRMKELDDTFEDKYTKLRIFALKLKKRVNEMTTQLQSAEADKARLEKLLSEGAPSADDAQSIRLKYEQALKQNEERNQEIEQLSKRNEELTAKLGDVASEEDAVAEKVVKDAVAEKVVKDAVSEKVVKNAVTEKVVNEAVGDLTAKSVDDDNTVLRQKIEELTKELESVRDGGGELEKLKEELSKKEAQLTSETEQHKATRAELDRTRRDVKKKSVLSLEMEDYERSMKELTAKMEENKKKMVQMESTVDTQQGTITSLKTQIKLLEEQIDAEEVQNRIAKDELHNATEEIKERDNLMQAKNDVILKLEQEVEAGKRSYEDLNVEMATLLGEKEKVILGLAQDKVELAGRLKRMECRCSELDDTLRVTNIELEDLKAEFASYKVRAQAVLRQNQTVDHSQEERLKEELAAVRSQLDASQAQLNTANGELEELRAASAAERRRAAEAAGEATRAQQRTARLHADLQRITQQLDAERAQAKLQAATLTQCYKSQLSELESRLERETQQLRADLEQARESGERAEYLLPVLAGDSDGELDMNVSMLPREEGEGSEAAPSPPLSKPYAAGAVSRSPVPLERLLEEGVPEDEVTDGVALGLTAEQELQDLRRKLQAQVLRVDHVTLLLAESERECARHSQLAELLKTEVRRARGAQHAHNTQYMKNVTLKFLTLPCGDERSRLVPVLQKLLTLSNEEAHALTAVAKGQDPSGKSGWGSYLPWSGK